MKSQVLVNLYSRGIDLLPEFPTTDIFVSFTDRNPQPPPSE